MTRLMINAMLVSAISWTSVSAQSLSPPTLPGDYNWRSNAVMSNTQTYSWSGDNYGSFYYNDLMVHTSDRDFQYGPSTHAHETTHGLEAQMRNSQVGFHGFFYFESGAGIYVDEPVQNLVDVKNHIGASFKQLSMERYNVYLVNQVQSWPNTLYIFDEWNAYVSTARSAVEIKKASRWDESNSDPLEGMIDFIYFCSASLISTKQADPTYLTTNTQFKAAYAMLAEQTMSWLNEGKKYPLWANSQAWIKIKNLQTAPDAAPVRQAIKELMGDVWTQRVLGF